MPENEKARQILEATMSTTSEVIMCGKCGGEGTIRMQELTDYHKSEYDVWTETCKWCNGSGRMVRTTTIELRAYVPRAADPTRR